MGRNLPSWMSSGDASKSHGKKPNDFGGDDEISEGEKLKQAKGRSKANAKSSTSEENKIIDKSSSSSSGIMSFSKLLEGVVFALSGFVNPERSILRSRALEMGAEYQPDWNSDCTLLVCAFPNTPKFRQVEANCGTIVSKEWISECYNQKKIVDIESYLMHVGKPWRKSNVSHEAIHDHEIESPRKPSKQIKGPRAKPTAAACSKSGASGLAKDNFSPSKVKKWAIDDLNKTMTWLESQEEKPEPSEIRQIAAEGILTCLQDAIDSLEQKQGIGQMAEQWRYVPRVVEELVKLEATKNRPASVSKEDLYRQAVACRHLYDTVLNSVEDDSSAKNKNLKTDADAYDSDETIEMTEEEIELAYNTMAS
ncbi:DNA-repair protein XRCC1 isoform X2 [Malania oleifera]|uniref:DNA-repair protein XRCC1 isoform X2 n=1 Tax=Malania oleifera TaxID=397392 RepID=UPI0025AE5EB0|nr:DNA-repair protein XRCC1 isoform X2 [Malania oleifera]